MPYWCDIAGHRLLTIFGKQPTCAEDVGSRWLHPRELSQYVQLRSVPRRASWLQGRMAIKQLVRAVDPQAGTPQELEIVSRDEQRDRGCAPLVYMAERVLHWRPGLSHTTRHYAACLAEAGTLSPGIDLVEHGELDEDRLRFWLRDDERTRLRRIGPDSEPARRALARLWGAKEAAFKTLPLGTAFQPQQLQIDAWDDLALTGTWRWANEMFSGVIRWDELPDLTLSLAIRHAAGSGVDSV